MINITSTLKSTSLIVSIGVISRGSSCWIGIGVLEDGIISFCFRFFIINTIIILPKPLSSSLIVYSSIRIQIITFKFMCEHMVNHLVVRDHFIAFLTLYLIWPIIWTTSFNKSISTLLIFPILLESFLICITRYQIYTGTFVILMKLQTTSRHFLGKIASKVFTFYWLIPALFFMLFYSK